MKKIFLVLLGVIFLTTGCEEESTTTSNRSNSLKYTWWQTTSGEIIQLHEDKCVLLDVNEKVRSNVCEFVDNAYGTGKSRITICNSFGSDCDTTNIKSGKPEKGDSFYSSYGGTYYYQGPVVERD